MGLKPDHWKELNSHAFREERPENYQRKRYSELRELCKDDSKALQQIDVFDSESPYHPHFKSLIIALRTGNKKIQNEEESWFSERYPDLVFS